MTTHTVMTQFSYFHILQYISTSTKSLVIVVELEDIICGWQSLLIPSGVLARRSYPSRHDMTVLEAHGPAPARLLPRLITPTAPAPESRSLGHTQQPKETKYSPDRPPSGEG